MSRKGGSTATTGRHRNRTGLRNKGRRKISTYSKLQKGKHRQTYNRPLLDGTRVDVEATLETIRKMGN